MKMQKDPKTFSTTKSRREARPTRFPTPAPVFKEAKQRRIENGWTHRQEKRDRMVSVKSGGSSEWLRMTV